MSTRYTYFVEDVIKHGEYFVIEDKKSNFNLFNILQNHIPNLEKEKRIRILDLRVVMIVYNSNPVEIDTIGLGNSEGTIYYNGYLYNNANKDLFKDILNALPFKMKRMRSSLKEFNKKFLKDNS